VSFMTKTGLFWKRLFFCGCHNSTRHEWLIIYWCGSRDVRLLSRHCNAELCFWNTPDFTWLVGWARRPYTRSKYMWRWKVNEPVRIINTLHLR
jgi:hypothetical protein